MSQLTRVLTKKSSKSTPYHVEFDNGVLTVYHESSNGTLVKGSSFKVGDFAEYDSYNLSYYGNITKITDKTVTIKEKYETRTRRLSMEQFVWRNFEFNLAKTQERNAIESWNL